MHDIDLADTGPFESEITQPKEKQDIGSSYLSPVYLFLFLPVTLIALQSYFKHDIIDYLGGVAVLDPEYTYFAARLILFVIFIVLLFRLPVPKIPIPRSSDNYSRIRQQLDPLLVVRAFACFNVFLGHWFLVILPPTLPPEQAWDSILRRGIPGSPWGGVWIFFALSGYLMTKGFVSGRHVLGNSGLLRFYRNRILRIIPVYLISIFVVALLVSPASLDLTARPSALQMLDALLFDQQGGGVIDALWSVSTEFQYYLAAPLIAIFLWRAGKSFQYLTLFALAILIVFPWAKYYLLTHSDDPETWKRRVYFPMLANLDCFIPGAVAAILVQAARKHQLYISRGFLYAVLVGCVSQLVLSLWSYGAMVAYPERPSTYDGVFFLAFAPAATATATATVIFLFEVSVRSATRRTLPWSVGMFFGTITYCLYVVHEPIFLALKPTLTPGSTVAYAARILPLALLLCLGAAYLLYRAVERQFDGLRR